MSDPNFPKNYSNSLQTDSSLKTFKSNVLEGENGDSGTRNQIFVVQTQYSNQLN